MEDEDEETLKKVRENIKTNAVRYGELFRLLGTATNRPGLVAEIPELLRVICAAMERSETTFLHLNGLKAQMSALVKEDRAPTPEEWQAIQSNVSATHEALAALELAQSSREEPPPHGQKEAHVELDSDDEGTQETPGSSG